MRFFLIYILLLLVIPTNVMAQSAVYPAVVEESHKVRIEKGERWYGAMSELSEMLPLEENLARVSPTNDGTTGQYTPFLVSSTGRYIYSEEPFDFEIANGVILIYADKESLKIERPGKTLRIAYLWAYDKYIKRQGAIPEKILFQSPTYSTWVELGYNQSQQGVEQYADAILSHGFDPGVIIIGDGWQQSNGNYHFRVDKFPDPRAMISNLQKKGFKVMLWISPFITPDGANYMELLSKEYLVKDSSSQEVAVVQWRSGYSAMYDMTNPEVIEYLTERLRNTMESYGVDGFKFSIGEHYTVNHQLQSYYKEDGHPIDQIRGWTELGRRFKLSQATSYLSMQDDTMIQRLRSRSGEWKDLQATVYEMLNGGLMGYSFIAPEVIGGGMYSCYINAQSGAVDQNLFVRMAQLQAFMPIIQFSMAPWRVLSAENLLRVQAAANLHKKMAPYIIQLAEESAQTGEPIVRMMEYMFPRKGFGDCFDQYMLGSRYLVAPILAADGKRTVRLPAGIWYDDLGAKFRGPLVITVQADIGRIPYYEKR